MPQLHLVYFSPTGSTRQIMRRIAEGATAAAPGLVIEEHDCTLPTERNKERRFTEADWVIFGMPVYYGRIPAPFHAPQGGPERFPKWQGKNTSAAHVVVYGDRAYDDALLELKSMGEGCGFVSMGSAAFVAQHSLNPQLGACRPHAEDMKAQLEFGKQLAHKMFTLQGQRVPPYTVPGNSPHKAYGSSPFIPETDTTLCMSCGICAACCPTQCIDQDNFATVRPQDCLCCRACIKYCPADSRKLAPALAEQFEQRMGMLLQMVREKVPNGNKVEIYGL